MTFDKIKIVSDSNNISCINQDYFEKKMKNGHIVGWYFKQETPFLLSIEKKNLRRELVIEFTGKILDKRYPELINSDTIKLCLDKINQRCICKLNVDAILEDATVVKCDVTSDVAYDDLEGLTSGIRTGIKNNKKYSCRIDGDNLTITNNVSTPNRKIRLVIYNKEKEMRRSKNAICHAQIGHDVFKEKVRFELNLTSVAQIHKRLKIDTNSLYSVLNSSATPIKDFLNDIIADKTGGVEVRTWSQFKNMLVLEKYNYDLAVVETIVRQYSAPKVSVKQLMKPFRELLDNCNCRSKNIKEELNQLLSS